MINNELHIYAELKNKHNTMNSRAADSVYRHMQNKILHDDKATCMLVEVIATQSRNEKWFYDNLSHEKIRRVSIDKFYGIVFGDDEAFFKLCKVLPSILDEYMGGSYGLAGGKTGMARRLSLDEPSLTAGDEAPNGARNLRIATPTRKGPRRGPIETHPTHTHPAATGASSHRSQQPLYRKCQRVEKKRFGT